MKLSVAMITYNHEKYIAQAMESILAQRVNFDYEIVVGEDCSTDGTRAILMDFQSRYPDRIRLLLPDRNVGVMQNFVTTLEACRGEYLALLEGDDYWIPQDKIQKQVDFLEEHPECAICCGRARTHFEAGTDGCDLECDILPVANAGHYKIEDLLGGNFIPTCTAMLRRKVIGRFPEWLLDVKLGDWPLFALCARYGDIVLVNEVLAGYRIHPGATWSSLSNVARSEESIRMLRLLDKELSYQYTDAIYKTISSLYLRLMLSSRSSGQKMDAFKYFFYCISNGGLRRKGIARTTAGMLVYALVGSKYRLCRAWFP
jgi:glycosyltransferase involved in cell wall biosynthesis